MADVDWDCIIGYDLPLALGYPTYNKTLENIFSTVLESEYDLWKNKQ